MGIKTHYDNLQVARNASPEVIRAAYKGLTQRYHPDRNPNDPDCERVMKLINKAYEVLSDPTARAMHDAWIATQEAVAKPQPAKTQINAEPAASTPYTDSESARRCEAPKPPRTDMPQRAKMLNRKLPWYAMPMVLGAIGVVSLAIAVAGVPMAWVVAGVSFAFAIVALVLGLIFSRFTKSSSARDRKLDESWGGLVGLVIALFYLSRYANENEFFHIASIAGWSLAIAGAVIWFASRIVRSSNRKRSQHGA